MRYIHMLEEETLTEAFIDALAWYSHCTKRTDKQLLEMPGMVSKSKDLAKTTWSGIASQSLRPFLRLKLLETFMGIFGEWVLGMDKGLHQKKLQVIGLHPVNFLVISNSRKLHEG